MYRSILKRSQPIVIVRLQVDDRMVHVVRFIVLRVCSSGSGLLDWQCAIRLDGSRPQRDLLALHWYQIDQVLRRGIS